MTSTSWRVLLLAWSAFAGSVRDDYFTPFSRYVKPVHVTETCSFPAADLEVYLFAFTRDDCPALLSHFLRWYGSSGIDLRRRSLVVVHANCSGGELSLATARTLDEFGVRVEYVTAYSSSLKAARANAFMDTLPAEAWLVYPDVDEFFSFPCWSRRPWSKAVDFVGGEMYDRVAADWRLASVDPNASLFRTFPRSYRATSCLMHLRPFKVILSRVSCVAGGKHRYESSHSTACYDRTPPAGANKTVRKALGRRKPKMYPTTYAFAHFRFTADAERVASDKRRAYERDAAKWRAAHPRLEEEARGLKPTDFDATPAERTAFSHLAHAAEAYKLGNLLVGRDSSIAPEVRLVLDIDCSGDRPGDPKAPYNRNTSGRLDDLKRRKLVKALAIDDDPGARARAVAGFFRHYYLERGDDEVLLTDLQRRRLHKFTHHRRPLIN